MEIIRQNIEAAKRWWCSKGLGAVTLRVHELADLRFRCANGVEVYRTAQYGGELAPLAAWLFLLKADDVVWDVGASVGLFALHSATRARQVVAFEPDPETAGRCEDNIRLNAMQNRIQLVRHALGSQSGHLTLHTDGLEGMAPSLGSLGRHKHTVEVRVSTVDDMVAEGRLPPTAVKIDVEGAEAEVLAGAPQLLSGAAAPRLIFLEVHPVFLDRYGATEKGLASRLMELGYYTVTTQRRDDQYHIIAAKRPKCE